MDEEDEEVIMVNQLATLLNSDEIMYIEVAHAGNQHHPKRLDVGFGGVLNIYFRKKDD